MSSKRRWCETMRTLSILLFFFSSSLMSQTPTSSHVIFFMKNAQNITKTYDLRLDKNQLVLNGYPLAVSQIVTQRTELHTIFNPSIMTVQPKPFCTAGVYTLTRMDNTNPFEEKGCMDSKRFSEISKAFRTLESKKPLRKMK